MKIAEISVRRPVFAVMLIGALVALGWISLGRLGVDLFPRVEFPFVIVQTTLEGASPDTIETEVTDVIEEQINTIAGVQSIRSVSSEGLSQVFVEFRLEEDVDTKAQDVRDKVALARADLPSDAEPPIVQKVDPDADPILSVMVAGAVSQRDITEYADRVVKRRLERVAGVGSVTRVGGQEREIRIWLDAMKLRAFGLTATDVIDALRRENAELPGGRLETPGAQSELAVKTMGEVVSVEAFENVVVAFRADGSPTRIGDIARVEDGLEDERTYAELNGGTGVTLEVRRQSGENTLAVAQAVKAALEEIRGGAPPGIALSVARDVSLFIEGSAADVFKDIQIGVLLVTLVTLGFLISIRATIIVAIAIPTSLISTFLLFYIGGFTLNMMTLMALQIAVGLVIDDAIVVLEAIYRKIEEGVPPVQAAIEGVNQVGMAVVAGTLAVVAVFVPIAFMDGVVGQFFYQYGLGIVFSVLVSLLVSVTLTPMLCARFLKGGHTEGWFARTLIRAHDGLDRIYLTALAFSLRRRLMVCGFGFLTIFAGFAIASTIPAAFSPSADRAEFLGQIDLPFGTGIETAKDVGRRAAAELRRLPEVRDVFFTIGGETDGRVNRISYYVALSPKSERSIDQFAIEDMARTAMARSAPEARHIAVTEVPWVSGGAAGQYQIMFSFEGPDLEILRERTDEIIAQMRRTGLYVDLSSSFEPGKPELRFEIDRDRAADLGVSVRQLAQTIRVMVGGATAGSFEEGGERYDVRVRLEEDQREDIASLAMIQVRAGDNRLVDLFNVATPAVEEGPAQIDRRNRARAITVQGNAAPGVALGTASDRFNAIVEEAGLPEGYRVSPFGQVERMKETGTAIAFAFGLAMLALYMVLASQFNSFGQPVYMMFAAPLAFFGAFIALKIAGLPMLMFAQIGLIALMGLVLKNGILIVDHANVARQERGLDAAAAMMEAGAVRLRPVLMTALSMICGMLPPALSDSQGSEFRAPMAVLVVGGMISSTVLTLLVVPAIYVAAAEAGGRLKSAGAAIAARLPLPGKRGGEPAE